MTRLLVRPFQFLGRGIDVVGRKIEPYLPAITIVALIVGGVCAKFSPKVSDTVNAIVSSVIDGYGYVAPVAIFLILTPCLAKLIRTRESSRFTGYVLGWLAGKRALSCLWAVAATVLIFGFPMMPTQVGSPWEALWSCLQSLGWMATHSSYFLAIYLGIAVAFVSLKIQRLYNVLDRCARMVETVGEYLGPITPVFMFAVGAYIYGLPAHLNEQLGPEAAEAFNRSWHLFGFEFDLTSQWGVIGSYVVGACLVGVACLLWNLALLLYTKARVSDF